MWYLICKKEEARLQAELKKVQERDERRREQLTARETAQMITMYQ